MADKQQLRHQLWKLQRVATWQLLVALAVAMLVAATFLRLNNIGMDQRREAVKAADAAGDQEATALRLQDLQRFVGQHMNTDMGEAGVWLKHQYERDSQKVVEATHTQGGVYQQAEASCRQRYPDYQHGTYLAYQQCFVDQLDQAAPGQSLAAEVMFPPQEAYRHIFVSPLWSPDFAGFSVLLCVLLAAMIVARLVARMALRLLLRRRYRSV